MEILELRRIRHEEMERARLLRTDELCVQKKIEPSAMNQFLSQICTLQDKVNVLNEEKEFYDPETGSNSGMSHVPSQPLRVPSPRGMLSRELDCRTFHGTRWVVQEMFLRIHLLKKEFLRPYQELTWRRIETRTAKLNNTDSTIFQKS